MSTQIIIVLILNFIISLIGTLAYAVRLVGVRTGKIAMSFALFNILMLVSRTALTFQTPILTKFVEQNQNLAGLHSTFNWIILVSAIAAIAGAFLIPTFQRIFCKAVMNFSTERSLPRLLLYSFTKAGIRQIKECVAIPVKESITKLEWRKLPFKIMLYNILAVALITIGSLAPVYAMCIEPELRATCITLTSVINGIATILMTVLIDPPLSVMTDDVISGKCSIENFRTCVVGMVGSKAIGGFAAFPLLIPAAYLIVAVARIL